MIDNYFEGTTSHEEEKELHRYFAQDSLPEDLKPYAPLFRFLHDEAVATAALREIKGKYPVSVRMKRSFPRKLRIPAVAAAMGLIAVLLLLHPEKTSPGENYVWVDGQKFTDPALVRKYAESSFGKVQPDNDIVEEQLRFMLE